MNYRGNIRRLFSSTGPRRGRKKRVAGDSRDRIVQRVREYEEWTRYNVPRTKFRRIAPESIWRFVGRTTIIITCVARYRNIILRIIPRERPQSRTLVGESVLPAFRTHLFFRRNVPYNRTRDHTKTNRKRCPCYFITL